MFWPEPDPDVTRKPTKNKELDDFIDRHYQDFINRSIPGLVPLPFETVDLMSSTRFQMGRIQTLRNSMDSAVKLDTEQNSLPSVDLATESTGHIIEAVNQLEVLSNYLVTDIPHYLEVIMRSC